MKADMINPFIEGAVHILDTTASVKLKAMPPFVKTDQGHQGDISGILEISGAINGSVVITFSETSILGIVSAMFGEQMNEMNEDINDAVGEICNMIAGQATTKINSMDTKVKIGLKEICVGKNKPIEHTQKDEAVVCLPFATTKGKFVMEICYTE
ncbi:MAG: chemotaxis protein CheX [Deltaproteobacteria bacterium]|nr:MAG: chemotaxis protein CheX [Deltaproteobacteria bacterium]